MITYLTTNPPTRMRTETSAVIAGAALPVTPPNRSADGEEESAQPVGADEQRPRRGADEDAGVSGEEESEDRADHADDATERPHAPTAPVLEEDVQRSQEREGAEREQCPRSRVHGRERLEVERPDGDGVPADLERRLGHHQHVEEARGETEVHGEDDRSRNHREESDVVPDPDDVAIPLVAEEVGDRGDHERPTGDTAEEEVEVDQDRPVRAFQETGLHHASPLPPRPLKATRAPSPTTRAEPIDRSESTRTLRCGSFGFSGSP